MTEGILNLALNVAIGTAICGLTGWMMSVSAHYRQNPSKGFLVGIGFGLATMVPLVFLVPFFLVEEAPAWMDSAWLITTIVFEAAVGLAFFRHRAAVSVGSPVKPVSEVDYSAMSLLKSDISPAA